MRRTEANPAGLWVPAGPAASVGDTHPGPCVPPQSGHCAIKIAGAVHSITEITAMFLNHLNLMCEVHFGEPVTMAVVSVPARFNADQRQVAAHPTRLWEVL